MARRRGRNSGVGVRLVALVLVGAALAGLVKHGGHHGQRATLTAAQPGSPAANRRLADRMAARRWPGGGQVGCLNKLWASESGFDQYNTYPSHDTSPSTPGSQITTAYGIPQAYPAQKMAAAGPDWQTDARTQIKWGLGYVAATYGDPCTAWNYKITHGFKGY